MNRPTTVTELIAEAANALIRRDPYRLEELAQIILLQAMAEAADLLLDTPSEIESA
ncbi:hypothetical protein ACNKFW_20395 (plasmid) [Paracoccus sp. TD-10]|uniref:hypothetical protein n=1 Tax=Paracoccus sp. TD-10 TaxID=3395918 RepID=UPI003AAB7E7D